MLVRMQWRRWLLRKMGGLLARNTQPAKVGRIGRKQPPSLELLEDRLPPGDLLNLAGLGGDPSQPFPSSSTPPRLSAVSIASSSSQPRPTGTFVPSSIIIDPRNPPPGTLPGPTPGPGGIGG